MASAKHLVLASTSPFRRQLLLSAGLTFTAVAPEVDEAKITAADPVTLAKRRAEAKALAVAGSLDGGLVIGADQVLSLDGRSYGKSHGAADARERLRLLSGRTHHLHAAVALAFGNRVLASFVVDVPMPMRVLTDAEIDAYVATGEWQGSVGAYQYENRGVHLFQGVTGDASAIVGLPLQELLAELRRLGVNPLIQPDPPWTLLS